MKRNLAISTALLTFLLVLSGCSNKNTAGVNNQNSQTGQNSSASQTSQKRGQMLDYGQPARQADIRGIVKSITGNEASILLMASSTDMGGRRASSSQENAAGGASSTGNAPSISLTGETANRGGGAGFMGGPGGQGRQGGGAGGPGGPGGPGGAGGGTTDRAAMLDQIKKISTGEDKVIIPVGIQMLKSSPNSSTNKREMVEASLSDITADKFITIWLNTSVTDKKVAEFVLIN